MSSATRSVGASVGVLGGPFSVFSSVGRTGVRIVWDMVPIRGMDRVGRSLEVDYDSRGRMDDVGVGAELEMECSCSMRARGFVKVLTESHRQRHL